MGRGARLWRLRGNGEILGSNSVGYGSIGEEGWGRRGRQKESRRRTCRRGAGRHGGRRRTAQTPNRPCSEAEQQRPTWGTNSQGPERKGQGRAKQLCVDRKGEGSAAL